MIDLKEPSKELQQLRIVKTEALHAFNNLRNQEFLINQSLHMHVCTNALCIKLRPIEDTYAKARKALADFLKDPKIKDMFPNVLDEFPVHIPKKAWEYKGFDAETICT